MHSLHVPVASRGIFEVFVAARIVTAVRGLASAILDGQQAETLQ